MERCKTCDDWEQVPSNRPTWGHCDSEERGKWAPFFENTNAKFGCPFHRTELTCGKCDLLGGGTVESNDVLLYYCLADMGGITCVSRDRPACKEHFTPAPISITSLPCDRCESGCDNSEGCQKALEVLRYCRLFKRPMGDGWIKMDDVDLRCSPSGWVTDGYSVWKARCRRGHWRYYGDGKTMMGMSGSFTHYKSFESKPQPPGTCCE